MPLLVPLVSHTGLEHCFPLKQCSVCIQSLLHSILCIQSLLHSTVSNEYLTQVSLIPQKEYVCKCVCVCVRVHGYCMRACVCQFVWCMRVCNNILFNLTITVNFGISSQHWFFIQFQFVCFSFSLSTPSSHSSILLSTFVM